MNAQPGAQRLQDEHFMGQALALAHEALFDTDPNPRVGCVVVKDGHIVGRGAHLRAGTAHAEVHALSDAGEQARGATAYVTLEPCNHHGRTPPCSEALLAAGVSRVVIAMADEHAKAAGGSQRLEAAGIAVTRGVLAAESRALNIGFHHRCETGKPWLRLKLAASLDGRTAAADGSSQWITGPEARADTQYWRARSSMILTGAGTVRDDNPQLNVRLDQAQRQPWRVILSHTFNVDPSAHIFHASGESTIYAPAEMASQTAVGSTAALRRNFAALTAAGIDARYGPRAAQQGLDLDALLTEWAAAEVNEIHAECGAVLAGQLLQQRLVDELIVYIAPKLLGSRGRPLAELPDLSNIQDALGFDLVDTKTVGSDIRLRLRRGDGRCSAD
ncbi:MAG: bifunctional diaminohydroxyphosphoribosylaminopyrimidine deaminase/5-amino-6-(5-phosphoribosylamino)uracil reductase RibD [Xanthomonadales bacterium]|nr:bifunctional diaminohydroxyphosphoribosylaminopyrimidine deaminase/5-amino-6-(5-phosphoribosylamino)uracil reductase RibD [Xanthomonadales bacterium]